MGGIGSFAELTIMVRVARGVPQIEVEEVGRDDLLVAARVVLVADHGDLTHELD